MPAGRHTQLPNKPTCVLQIQVLGQGTFGVVAKALDLRRDPPVIVAIKLLRRGDFIKIFRTYVKREIVHQSSLKHPFIIGLREVGQYVHAVAKPASSAMCDKLWYLQLRILLSAHLLNYWMLEVASTCLQ